MQRYTIRLFLQNALHVSGGSSAHHQELKTIHTASDICYLSLSWRNSSTTAKGRSNGWTNTRCCMYSFWAPDDGRRNRLKHVEHFAGISELCNVASCWLYLKIHLRCRDPWTSKRIYLRCCTYHSIDGTDSDLVAFLVNVNTKHRTSLLPELQGQLTAYSLSGSRNLMNITKFQIWIYFHKNTVNAWAYYSKFQTFFSSQRLRIPKI
jgi:hypothetical protein